MGTCLHKVFKVFVKKLNNSLRSLGELDSEVYHFRPETSNFAKFIRLPAEVKNAWMKATSKENKILLTVRTF